MTSLRMFHAKILNKPRPTQIDDVTIIFVEKSSLASSIWNTNSDNFVYVSIRIEIRVNIIAEPQFCSYFSF